MPQLRSYLVEKAVLDDLENLQSWVLVDKKIIKGVAESILKNKRKQNELFKIAQESRRYNDKSTRIAAINALSILGQAGLLRGRSLQGIRASVKVSALDNSLVRKGPFLEGVDLTGCNLQGADIRCAQMHQAIVDSVNANGETLVEGVMGNCRHSGVQVVDKLNELKKEGGCCGSIKNCCFAIGGFLKTVCYYCFCCCCCGQDDSSFDGNESLLDNRHRSD